jgi:S-adenosylmethionine decarboxylase
MIDANICQEQVFHTKMALNHFDLDDYLFQVSARDPDEEQRHGIGAKLKLEMMEILYGRNM